MVDATGLTPFIPALTGIAGAAIAWSVYRLALVQRQDAWLRTLWEFHRAFWQDEKMEKVRSWIACDEAYKEVRPILAKRVEAFSSSGNQAPVISVDEYKLIELIDRFAALLMGYTRIAPADHPAHRKVRQHLYDSYWTRQISRSRRPELRAYLEHFFPELLDGGEPVTGGKSGRGALNAEG